MTMKDTYYFDEPINRIGSGSYKWDTEGEGGDPGCVRESRVWNICIP